MSWSATSDEVRSSNLWADLAGIEATGQDYSLLSVSEAVAAARMAAGDLIESGALGEDKVFRVTLAGHANDGHNPDPPWTNDTISVTVSQIRDE